MTCRCFVVLVVRCGREGPDPYLIRRLGALGPVEESDNVSLA